MPSTARDRICKCPCIAFILSETLHSLTLQEGMQLPEVLMRPQLKRPTPTVPHRQDIPRCVRIMLPEIWTQVVATVCYAFQL